MRRIRLHKPGIALLAMLVGFAPRAESRPAQASNEKASSEVKVGASVQWVDTHLDLRAQEKLRFTATGSISYPANPSAKSSTPAAFGPDGLPRSFRDLLHEYAVPDAGHGALIARLGSDEAAQPFLVGASKEFQAPVAGHLFLGINQSLRDAESAEGGFTVQIEILDPGLATAAGGVIGGPAEAPIAGITSAFLKQFPRRVADPQGNPGDMVNILIIGSQQQLVAAFKAAGWVQVDASVGSTVVSGLIASLSKESYLTMPMSTLYLFGRQQDYGFAHAEPLRVALSRNHLRVWKSSEVLDGTPVWCIAATHDIGLERDQRNNGVTHKIDPAIDGEREYVNETLSGTGLVEERLHVSPSDPLTEAKTATGGSFHSDGRILVLKLKPAAGN